MWSITKQDDVSKRFRKAQKKHRTEMKNVLDNLDTFFRCLQAGSKPTQIQRGFIHPEPMGVLAIDQSGPGAHLKEFRLYVYPDEDNGILHVITLGDKNSQRGDIILCKNFVEELRATTEKDAEETHAKGGRN